MSDPILSIQDVSFVYEQKPVLESINFEIQRGSFVGLVGPNGSGKTTLIKLILGLLRPQTGSIQLFQTPIQKFHDWSKMGFVSQKANSFNAGFPATVSEVVSTGLTAKIGYFRFFSKQDKEKVKQALNQVEMLDYLNQNIGNLSGGQQQRVFIARALVSDPELLILDEPTVGVDQEHVQKFYHLLAELNKKRGITLLLVTHDIGTVTSYVSQIACLNKSLQFHGDPESFAALSDQEVSDLYGHPLHVVTHHDH
ncbi:metal ABC transporter ATP-binding protein [Bacillaceae bacterium S4-13-56]